MRSTTRRPASGASSHRCPRPAITWRAIAVDGLIHAIGGRFDASNDNTGLHDVYDPAGATPVDVGGAAADAAERRLGRSLPGLILVAGGECNSGKPFTEHEGFDVKTGRWSTLAPMPSPRHGIQAATDGRIVYIPGGAPACGTAASDTLQTFRFLKLAQVQQACRVQLQRKLESLPRALVSNRLELSFRPTA